MSQPAYQVEHISGESLCSKSVWLDLYTYCQRKKLLYQYITCK